MNPFQSIKQFLFIHIRLAFGLVVIIAAIGTVWYIVSNSPPNLPSYAVGKGNVVASVDIPGTVSSSDSVALSFQESGKIASVNVQEGQMVTQGQVLASLSASSQQTQLEQEQAALAAAQANYQKLLAGATTQSVQTSQDAVNSANQNLTNAYSGAMNTLNTASTTIYNTYNLAVSIQNKYFNEQDSEGIAVSGARSDLNASMSSAQSSLAVAQKSMAPTDINAAVTQMSSSLNNAYSDISIIRAQCDQGTYYYAVTSTDKASLDSQKASVSAVLTSVTALQQSISSLALALQTAQDQLNVTTEPPTTADISSAKAQIAAAQAQIESANVQINNTTIVAPFSGMVINVVGQVGMVVSPNAPVLSLINNQIMKFDAFAPESEVSQIQANASANVVLDAYNGPTFPAKVTAIDTGTTMFNGSPAYQVTLYFTEPDARIFSGMTGNVLVTTGEHDNVVTIPSRLVLASGNNTVVRMQDGSMRQITIGLTGSNNMVEVVSGLQAGEKLSDY